MSMTYNPCENYSFSVSFTITILGVEFCIINISIFHNAPVKKIRNKDFDDFKFMRIDIFF